MSEKTILLVDDDPEIVKTVRHYLQQEGYAVLVAYNGKDALAIVALTLTTLLILTALPLTGTAASRLERQPLESLTALNGTEATERGAALSAFSTPGGASTETPR